MKKESQKTWFQKYGLAIILGVIVLFVAAALSNGKNDIRQDKNTTYKEPAQQENKSETKSSIPKIGEPARDGKFEFIVKSVECDKSSVGTNEYLTKQAQGQFCLLTINVKNIGNEPQGLYSGDQKLINAQSQEFASDSIATSYVDSNSWYNNINPGNNVEGILVFDMPKGQRPVKAIFHDSAFSGGVTVSLE